MLARSRFVAAMTRVSTRVSSVAPTGLTFLSCKTRRSLTCMAGDISPISSRKIVPLFAASKSPFRFALDQDRRLDLRDSFNHPVEIEHPSALPNNVSEFAACPLSLNERFVFFEQ